MKSKVENISSVQRRLKLTVPREVVDKAFDSKYKILKKKSKLQGFRAGKAPLFLVKKLYQEQVSYEVSENLIKGNLYDVIREHKLPLVSPPLIEDSSMPMVGSDYEFSAVVDISPTVELSDSYKKLTVSCPQHKLDESYIDIELKSIARKRAVTEPLAEDTAAQKGHVATISHTASLQGKIVAKLDVKKVEVALGEKEILAELEAAIIGMKKNSEKIAKIVLPKDYQDKELAGKDLEFTIALQDLSNLRIPKIDDELAKDMDFDNLDALKENIRGEMKKQIDSINRELKEKAILSELETSTNIEIPPSMLHRVVDSMIKEAYRERKDLKQLLKNKKLRDELEPNAKKKAKEILILEEIKKKEKVTVADEEVREFIASTYMLKDKDSDLFEKFYQATKESVEGKLSYKKIMDAILSHTKVKALPVDESHK